jgi:uracil-DNA glycosylase
LSSSEAIIHALRQYAERLDGIDRPIYLAEGRDPLMPLLGGGASAAAVAFFGRDPGREEIRHQLPFIGAGGQKVRQVLYRHHYGGELPDFEASVAIGQHYFWANTVPYKPIGNKAWSMRVKRQLQPWIARWLLQQWHGDRVITLGREAFFWFTLGQSPEITAEVAAFWQREDRFSAALTLTYHSEDQQRQLTLYPLPHPSPLNATWYRRFPALLAARLAQIDATALSDQRSKTEQHE